MKYILNIRAAIICAAAFTLFGCSDHTDGQPSGEKMFTRGVVSRIRQIKPAGVAMVNSDAQGGIRGNVVNGEQGKADSDAAGSVTQKSIPEVPELQITVKLDNGDTITVTQREVFEPGDLVRVVSIRGETRVIHNGPSEMRHLSDTVKIMSPVREFDKTPFPPPAHIPPSVQYYAWNQYQGFPTIMMLVNIMYPENWTTE